MGRAKRKPASHPKKPTFDYQNGFWLDRNIFIKADDAEIKTTKREAKISSIKTENAQIVIFANAVEIIVNKNHKIIGVKEHKKFGLWLQTINDALRRIKKNHPPQ